LGGCSLWLSPSLRSCRRWWSFSVSEARMRREREKGATSHHGHTVGILSLFYHTVQLIGHISWMFQLVTY
jgi:hypothetical protein